MPYSISSRLGSGAVALLIAASLSLASLPVDAANHGHHRTACATKRHYARQCVRVTWHKTSRHATVKRTKRPHAPSPAGQPLSAPTVTSGGMVGVELALVNRDRAAAGLPSLRESAALDHIATVRAQDMAANDYFSHYRPGDSTLAVLELLRAGAVPFSWYGENIIWESGQTAGSLGAYFNAQWMNSPGHRANILNGHFGHIGVGIAVSGSRVYMVEDFTN